MIRLFASAVWGGVPKGVYQEYGPTTVPGEPYSYRDKSLFHCGIDVGDLGIGWPLQAARSGVVVSVGWGQLGILVGAETDWYIHIDRSAVSLGQRVTRGQLVAYSGGKVPSGGVIYGAHLHFEVQTATPPLYNRPLTSVDPEDVLTGLFSGGSGALGDEVDPHLLAQLMYLAGLGRVYGSNPDGSVEGQWLVDLIVKNPSDVGATLGAVVNSPEGKAWAATLAKVRAGGFQGPKGTDGTNGKDAIAPTTTEILNALAAKIRTVP